MKILGIESSCDETAASVVEDGRLVLSNAVATQIDIHTHYGGVVPEIAARSHIEAINPVIDEAMTQAGCTWDDIDAIAVSYAPGLIGSLLVGVLAARTLAILHNKPLYPVHHVEGHVYANFITEAAAGNPAVAALALPSKQPTFPMLALAVSGLHSQLVLFRDHGDYELLGHTLDDAVGEAFDKVSRFIGLGYPGGPAIAKAALEGHPYKYEFPKANLKCTHKGTHTEMLRKAVASSDQSRIDPYDKGVTQPLTQRSAPEVCHYYDFSFSGLKTAVLRAVQREVGKDFTFPSHELPGLLTSVQQRDFAASFQRVAVETLVDKTVKACEAYGPASVVIAGGVAANQELRRQLAERLPIPIEYAPIQLCTDNAAMIATLGYYRAQRLEPSDPYTVEVMPSLSMTKSTWATEV